MKLRDIFTEAFWKARWKETLDGFAAYGRAQCGMPPLTDEQLQELTKPAPEAKTKPVPPAPPFK